MLRTALLALAIKVAQSSLEVQEDCPREQLPAKDENTDLGLVMLQVSREAVNAATRVTEKQKHASDSVWHVHGAQEQTEKLKTELSAAAGSEQAVDHQKHAPPDHEHPMIEQAKENALQKTKQKDEPHSQLQKEVDQVSDHEQNAPITMGSCFSSEYGYMAYFLTLIIVSLLVGLHFQHKANAKLSAKVRGLRARLRADKYIIKADERKLRAEKELLRDEQKRLIAAIHDRGNIFFDPELRQIVLKRAIPFEPVVRLEGVSMWQTLARYTDPQHAMLVLSDVAEVCQILPFACFLIEGHTLQGGSLDEIDEFAHEVADARALLVKATLTAFGVPPDRLEALGLPGALGNNKAEVLLKLVN